MNFLAHIYLSGDDDLIKIGNFMADGIRGLDYLDYPPKVQKGILLHRAIDTFTDAHPIFRKSKHRLHEKYGHYSGVIIDISRLGVGSLNMRTRFFLSSGKHSNKKHQSPTSQQIDFGIKRSIKFYCINK